LSGTPELKHSYLVGRTALNLHLGHKRENDLNFFSLTPGVDLDALKASVQRHYEGVQVVQQTDVTLR
jgi:hypothetical protein